jgi:hypothetical protein
MQFAIESSESFQWRVATAFRSAMFYDVCDKTGHVFNRANRSPPQRRAHERSSLTASDQRHSPSQQGLGRGGHDHPMRYGHPADREIGAVPNFITYVK